MIRSVFDGGDGLISGGRFDKSSDKLEHTDEPLLLLLLRSEDGDCAGGEADIMIDETVSAVE